MFTPRKKAPTKALGHDDHGPLSFRVWTRYLSYAEDERPWKCVGAFMFLQEALDYIAHCQDVNVDVVFQSPADCKTIKAEDRRVVYRPDNAKDKALSYALAILGRDGIRPMLGEAFTSTDLDMLRQALAS